MTPIRLTIFAATLVLLTAASAAAEPAYVASTVNLRAGAGTDTEIVGKIPAGSRVDAINCSDWCEVEWQGKKGFVIASAVGRAKSARRTQRDPYATDVAVRDEVPMSAGAYEAPGRHYGPFFWGYGPSYGPYRGTSGIGYRGRW